MRHSPTSWSDSLLARLGFRRKRRRQRRSNKFLMRRRPQLESLEQRAMLASDLYLVTTLADVVDANDGYVSLREAITLAANDGSTTDNDTIQFDGSLFAAGPANITLTYDGADSGTAPDELLINSDLTIYGPGRELLSISGNDQTRVLRVQGGTIATISELTVTGGSGASGYASGYGGGILNSGVLTLDAVTLYDNHAANVGGGIISYGQLFVYNSTIDNNRAVHGGGIYADMGTGDELLVQNSTVSNNTAADINGNGTGGGVSVSASTTGLPVNIINSTISGNSSAWTGGVRGKYFAEINIVNSTITNNSAAGFSTSSAGGVGGVNSTVITLNNTIVAGNTAVQSGTEDAWRQQSWTINVAGSANNVIGIAGNSGFTNNVNGNRVGTYTNPLNPGLLPLGNYGGPTRSHALLPTSIAINSGNTSKAKDSDGNPLTHDQNGAGFERALGGAVDIGASESHIVSFGPELLVYGTGLDDAISVREDQIVIDRISTFNVDVSSWEAVWILASSGDDFVAVDLPPAILVEIYGEAGDDTLQGSGGNDLLNGGSGNDVLYGGSGNDMLVGATGNDLLFGESGNDALYGYAGDDQLFGGDGADILSGGSGDDLLDGGPGEDSTNGGDGVDQVDGVATDNLPPWIVWMGNPTVNLLETPSIQLRGGTIFEVQVHAVDPEGDPIYYGLQAFDDENVPIPLSAIGASISNSGYLSWNVHGQTITEIEDITLRVTVSDQPPGGGSGSSESSGSATADIQVEVTPDNAFAPPTPVSGVYGFYFQYQGAQVDPPEPGIISIYLGPENDPETGETLNYSIEDGPGSIDGNYFVWDVDREDLKQAHRVVISVEDSGNPAGTGDSITSTSTLYIHPALDEVYVATLEVYRPPLAFDAHAYASVEDPIIDGSVTGSFYSENDPNDPYPVFVIVPTGDDNPIHLQVLDPAVFETDGPSHAAVWEWDSETGTFSYTPEAGFTGVDEFTFTITTKTQGVMDNEGIEWEETTSNEATVYLYVGSGATVQVTPEERPDDDPPPPCEDCAAPGQPNIGHNAFSGGPRVNVSMGGGLGGSYRSDSGPTIVRADFQVDSRFQSGSSSPNLNFNYYIDGVEVPNGVTVNTSAVPMDSPGSFIFAVDHGGVKSGYRKISAGVSISTLFGLPVVTRSSDEWVPIISQDDYGFGRGWNLAGIERLLVPPPELTIGAENPVYWLRADGYVLKFHGIGVAAENDVDASRLEIVNGKLVLTNKHGEKSLFSVDGWLEQRFDRYGNGTLFVYDDVDNDGDYHEIKEIIDQTTGHKTTFAYATDDNYPPTVTTITDFAGRVTHIGVDLTSRRLYSFRTPDQSELSVTTFSYDTSDRLIQMTDADGNITVYTYSPDGQTVTTDYIVTGPNGSEIERQIQTHTRSIEYKRLYVPGGLTVPIAFSEGEKLPFGELPPITGSYTDELGRVTRYETGDDRYVSKVTDPSGRITEYERNAVGQVTLETLFDANGTTILDQTSYTYDSKFNLTSITYFDGSSEHWTYDSLSRILSYADELGRQTLYTYVDYNGTLNHGEQFVTVRQVVGLNDATSSEANDLVTVYEHDPQGLLISMTEKRFDADGTPLDDVVTEYTYTEEAAPCGCGGTVGVFLESITYAVGTDDEATVTVLDHDAAGNPTRVQDEIGRVTTYRYDEVGRTILVMLPDPDGAGQELSPITQYVYSETGRLLEQVQTSGSDPDDEWSWSWERITTTFTYDARGRMKRVTAGFLATTDYEYDAAGNLTAQVFDPWDLNRRTEYVYDTLNRPIRITGPDPDLEWSGDGPREAPELFYSYDALGRLIAERDEHGSVTRYEYDARHRLTKIVAPLGATTEYLYDAAGQLIRETDPLGRVTQYAYDGAGRLTSVLEPGASLPTTYQYDTLGNLRFVTDPLSHVTEYQYDARSRLVKEIDANDAETLYEYNDANELVALADPALNTTTWTYDAAGRVKSEANELDDARLYKYDAFGRVIQVTDRNERVTTYAYDDLHRLREETWYANQAALNASQPLRFFQFDYATGTDQLDAVSDFGPNGEYGSFFNYQFTYDNLGNQTKTYLNLEALGLAEKVAFDREFDAGRLEKTSARIGVAYHDFGAGGTADFVNQYRYDSLGRLTRVTQGESAASGHHEVAEKRVDFTYNRDSTLNSVTRLANLAGTALVAASNYTYDQRGRLSSLTHKRNSTTFAGYGFTYDDANRLTGFSNSAHTGESAAYTYDDRGQLTVADRDGISNDESYDYGLNGNRNFVELGGVWGLEYTGDNNQLTRALHSYQYDDEGNRVLEYRDWNSNGQFDSLDTEITEYTYDHRNRLVEVTSRDTYGGAATKIVDYEYDAFNQLVKRTVDSDGAGTSPTAIDRTFYLYDQGQVALEFHKTGSGAVEAADLAHRYLWNPAAIDQLLADEQISSPAATGEVLWALTDHLGSVRDVVESDGTLRIHKNYDSFGNVIGETHYNSSGAVVTSGTGYVDVSFEFTGRFKDEATGLQNNLNRWYDASVGRWLSEDPIWDGVNKYAYVGNTPTMYVDPSGLKIGVIEQEEWYIVTGGGQEYAGSTPKALDDAIQDIRGSGGIIERCIIKGHGDGTGVFDRNENPLFEISNRGKGIRTGKRNALKDWQAITGPTSSISLRGCWTSQAASDASKLLPGTTVTGSPFWAIGIPETTIMIGPWSNWKNGE